MGRHRGFTLLELLVAIAVFSVMAAMAYSGLNGLVRHREQVDEVSERLRELQVSMDLVRRDIAQAVVRPVRDALGDTRPAFAAFPGRFELEFTRSGWTNPLGHPRSHLRRVAYRFEQGALVRYGTPVLDGARPEDVERRVLITGLQSLTVRLLDPAGEWQTAWPGPGQPETPLAVRLELELRDWGRVRRVFPVDLAPPTRVSGEAPPP